MPKKPHPSTLRNNKKLKVKFLAPTFPKRNVLVYILAIMVVKHIQMVYLLIGKRMMNQISINNYIRHV